MKTYQLKVDKNCLDIFYDTEAESPRTSQDNLGYFYTKEKGFNSPDGVSGAIYDAMIEAKSEAQDAESHIKAITRIATENTDEQILFVYPVYKYEHGNVVYRRGTAKGFDYSNCGFYIITDKTLKAYGEHAKPIEALIDGELEEYTAWVNGEVYAFTLKDKTGEVINNGGGYYDIDDIQSDLPKEYANDDLRIYLTN